MPDRPQNRHLIPAKPGEVRNPKGRPKGSRNKLSEAFIAAVYDDWQEHGAAVIDTVRTKSPVAYLRIVASLLPRDLQIKPADPLDDYTDEQLEALIQFLASIREEECAETECEPAPAATVPKLPNGKTSH